MTSFTEPIWNASLPFILGLLLVLFPKAFTKKQYRNKAALKLVRLIGLGFLLFAIFVFLYSIR